MSNQSIIFWSEAAKQQLPGVEETIITRVFSILIIIINLLEACRSELVCSQATAARGEGDRHHHRLLPLPPLVLHHDIRVGQHVLQYFLLSTIFVFLSRFYLRIEMGELIGLGVDPAKGFHLFKVGVLRQLLRQVHLKKRGLQHHTK